MANSFLPQRGNYRNLIVYQKAECIYDLTFYFTGRYLSRGDRTVDQMVQAARSGKQNIVEGSAASTTSRETEIKLYNVAKASLQELIVDYEDYLRVRGLEKWTPRHHRFQRTVDFCASHNSSKDFRQLLPKCNDEEIANLAITLICQADAMMRKLIESVKAEFLREGGIREQMTRSRIDYRNSHPQPKADSEVKK